VLKKGGSKEKDVFDLFRFEEKQFLSPKCDNLSGVLLFLDDI